MTDGEKRVRDKYLHTGKYIHEPVNDTHDIHVQLFFPCRNRPWVIASGYCWGFSIFWKNMLINHSDSLEFLSALVYK